MAIVDYVFQWQTPKQTDFTADKVTFNQVELQFGDPDVSVKQWHETIGGVGVYRHELRWHDQDCVIENIPFTVTASRGGFSLTSAQMILKSKICTPDNDPGDPPEGGQ